MHLLAACVLATRADPTTSESMWASPDVTPCDADCKQRLPEPPGGRARAERHLGLASSAITGMLYPEAGSKNSGCGGRQNPERCFGINLPFNATMRYRGDDWPSAGVTMIGVHRLRNFREAVESVIANGIQGDIAELGVWRGGASIFARTVVEAYGEGAKRRSLVFDAFESISAYGFASPYLAVSERQVRSNFAKYGVLDEPQVRFYKGFFNVSVPAFRASEPDSPPIAVLRVDGNFYSSYQDAFYALYERVPKGGIVILDDVGSHHAVQLFWSHFVKDYGITERLHPVGPHEAWFRKRTMAKLDRSKYRQVQLPELSGYSVTFAGDSKPQDMSVLPPKPARQWGKWAMEDESRV